LGLIATAPNVLKIDRRLTRDVENTGQSQEVISSIVAIARTQNIAVLAEGVERQAQAELLRDLGCDILQGFLYAPALEETEFRKWAQCRSGPKGHFSSMVNGSRKSS
jgi:EAL domain-containing protein (putative c-di-GMP-specific phosphodiesterase class I)